MNGHLSLSTIPASNPPSGLLRALVALWRSRLERRRQIRAFDGLADMNEHLLRDIGASDWSMSRAATRTEATHQPRFEMGIRL